MHSFTFLFLSFHEIYTNSFLELNIIQKYTQLTCPKCGVLDTQKFSSKRFINQNCIICKNILSQVIISENELISKILKSKKRILIIKLLHKQGARHFNYIRKHISQNYINCKFNLERLMSWNIVKKMNYASLRLYKLVEDSESSDLIKTILKKISC